MYLLIIHSVLAEISFNYFFVTVPVTILDILATLINHQSLIKQTCMLSEDQLPTKEKLSGLQQIVVSLQWDLKRKESVFILTMTEGVTDR